MRDEHGGRPLSSPEAEQSVIGALLLNNQTLDLIDDVLVDRDFAIHAHRLTIRAIQRLIRSGRPADVMTVAAELETDGDLDAVGGLSYLGEILMAVPTSANIAHYAATVRDKSLLRQAIAAAQTVVEGAVNPTGLSGTDVVDRAQAAFGAIGEQASDENSHEIKDLLFESVQDMEAAQLRGGALAGVSTGLVDLDARTGGLQDGDLVIIAGRPSMGKTSLAMGVAIHAATNLGEPVAVFSLEMSAKQLTTRAIANVARVEFNRLRDGKLEEGDWERVMTATGRLGEAPLFIDDSAGLTVEKIRARSRRIKKKHGLGLIVIDYLQLMSSSTAGENRQAEVSEISRGLKSLARELHVPCVTLAQLNRKCEERGDKRPLMSDLRDSGAIEQDADLILFVYRDEIYNPQTMDKGMAEIIIGKQRNGEVGSVNATFLGQFNRFENTEWRGRAPLREPPKTAPYHDF